MGELENESGSPKAHEETEKLKETDKMLENKNNMKESPKLSEIRKESPKVEKKVTKNVLNGEEIVNIPESEETIDKTVTNEGREVKPKKIPIGGIKMPGFFTKIKPQSEIDESDGVLLDTEETESKTTKEKSVKDEILPNIQNRIRNFFSKKQSNKKEDETVQNEVETTKIVADSGGSGTVPFKKGLLNAIKLPIANMIPKKTETDLELGCSSGKAGLASMETLDDSMKDQDTVDRVPKRNEENIDKIKNLEENKTNKEKPERLEENLTIWDRIKSYTCSFDDGLIVLGTFVFLLLLGVLCYVIMYEETKTAPIREGKYVDAITSCGLVEGIREEGAFAFRGIPYAVPPVGENRWKPAQLIENVNECWNGTYKAHNSTDVCLQILSNGTKVGSENCLTLDIITPQVRYDNPVPVIVLIGAESLTGGSPGVLRPSGRQSRIKDVIFVRPNFRLGPFGFLALEILSKSTHPPTSGNYGLSDIIVALKWIKLNIAHFGGDTDSITLLGHRAGGTLVSALVTSSQMKNLYSKAWISSSASIFPGRPLVESEKRNEAFLSVIQCKDIECLRNADAHTILNSVPDTWRYHPSDLPSTHENPSEHHEWLVLDGVILKKHPADILKSVKEETEPLKLVMGTTAQESHNENLYQKFDEWTPEIVLKYIENSKFGSLNLTEEIIKRYNLTYQGLVTLISDIRTVCPLLTMVKLHPSIPFYVVTHPDPKTKLADVNADIQSILGRYEPHTTQQRRYMASMQNLFYYYIAHEKVPQFDSRRRVIDLGQDPLPVEDYSHCNFLISKDIVPRYARID